MAEIAHHHFTISSVKSTETSYSGLYRTTETFPISRIECREKIETGWDAI